MCLLILSLTVVFDAGNRSSDSNHGIQYEHILSSSYTIDRRFMYGDDDDDNDGGNDDGDNDDNDVSDDDDDDNDDDDYDPILHSTW